MWKQIGLAVLVVICIRALIHSVPGDVSTLAIRSMAVPATSGAMRTVLRSVKGQKMMEGAGVRICRTVGTSGLRNLDPFLMLDELKCPSHEAAAGFPDHPHRGFETCSIMLTGAMEHKDSAGNQGIIRDGGVQWMTAGRGIVHSEMPKITDGDLHGFQLWINLPAKDKMIKPRYQDYQSDDIPVVPNEQGCSVRVMAGTFLGTTGPVELRNPGLLMDVRVSKDGKFDHAFPSSWNCFAYVYAGNGTIGGSTAQLQHAVVLEKGDFVEAAAGDEGLSFLLIAGQPIGEPIVQHGPFVMNTQPEIYQAFSDFQSGKLQNPDDKVWQSWKDEV